MKTPLKVFKWIIGIIVTIIVLLILWLSIPEVKKYDNQSGVDFVKTNNWNQDSILLIKDYLSKTNNIDAFIAIDGDEEIFSFGETAKLINLHSARKPIISLLFGIARDKGLIDIDETLGDLGITENDVELTEIEQKKKKKKGKIKTRRILLLQ